MLTWRVSETVMLTRRVSETVMLTWRIRITVLLTRRVSITVISMRYIIYPLGLAFLQDVLQPSGCTSESSQILSLPKKQQGL